MLITFDLYIISTYIFVYLIHLSCIKIKDVINRYNAQWSL